ncbi:COG3740 Phage head maturation protease [uncultured Caudovirales phage]|uniref:COG3740 Phage head maturation protease n=1 Tax=uncultured Caudovirales phage TaxID=2100421 RepID=A0A6J5SBF0_9CAUD|nr:COG3740 Phage head maturation protease [uncultured Caudovirales phage]CAB4176316.1 COG3740 Phage head maturation protease [uncultured Caudovirales phage]CAB4181487.1 COG3740 Phage head maturation protease [uncultured Caudovirales phage]CAB4197262.1 COG3740 Phage head maturation protease [uncultured Caudovirales phage]CAB4211002.1 COG3740 Phage head maturation protease [uncultured Caudovirales phage]
MNIERRSLLNTEVSFPAIRVEKRNEQVPDQHGGEPKVMERDWCVGYASVFGLLSLDLGDFVERIDPRAFDSILENRDSRLSVEPRALWNHDSNYPLARYPETLRLHADERGLRYEFPFGRTSYAQDLRMNIEDGIVKGSSFGFVVAPGGESWGMEDGRSVRTVKAISALYDVSPTTYPAYPDSDVTVAQRSFDRFRATIKEPVSQVRRSKEIEKFLAERAEKHGGKIR